MCVALFVTNLNHIIILFYYRISVGIEDANDLIADLEYALKCAVN